MCTFRYGLVSQVQFPFAPVHNPADVKPNGGGEAALARMTRAATSSVMERARSCKL